MSKLKTIKNLVNLFKGSTDDTLGEFFKNINTAFKPDLVIMKTQLKLKDSDRIQNLVILTQYWADTYSKAGLKTLIQMWKLSVENKTLNDLSVLLGNPEIYDILNYKILVHIYEDYFKGNCTQAELQKIPETMKDNPIPPLKNSSNTFTVKL